ncbi:MAG: hypothetical protein KDJ52_15105 [Anaerolineae bacterium]|nr:hypothetical protein [Anaerolineae bacterium]
MSNQEKHQKYSQEPRGAINVASVVGNINFRTLSNQSQLNVSLDQVEMDERELDSTELKNLFTQIDDLLHPDSSSSMSSQQREEMKYIIDGLKSQLRRGQQNNKQILRRFLRFLDDSAPEISGLILAALS